VDIKIETASLSRGYADHEEVGMPFLDDEFLWCSDNDGKLIDLSCLVS
jgi:hypothetical protein